MAQDNALTEEEMRAALFGGNSRSATAIPPIETHTTVAKPGVSEPKRSGSNRSYSSRLRVTLRVSKIYDGTEEVFVHDADTLSSLLAEGEAKQAARKKKFKYFEVVSIRAV
jgi:hypothetical protein